MAETKYHFIVLLLYLVNIGESFDVLCEDGFCRTYRYDTGCTAPAVDCGINNATHSGIWLPSPTMCNCCEFCLPFYGEGNHCSTGGPGLGTTVGRCGDGLSCDVDDTDGETRCKRMESKCHSDQDEYDARHATGDVGALEHRPLCDGKGKYAAYDCVSAHTCFCQSEDGERLFGEVMYMGASTAQNMHCGCSRIHEKIQKTISPGVPLPVIGPRCTSDGNFNPVQCINRTCVCVNKITGEVLEGTGRMIDLDQKPLTALSCYEADLDLFPQLSEGEPPYNYTTPCFEDMQTKIDFIKESEEAGYIVEFFSEITECMPDGNYGRVLKTWNGTKICANERGRQIEDYSAEPNTAEYDSMDCKCAKTSLIMGTSSEKPVCCKNGNFRKIQCRRGECRCVDSDGRQTERESTDVTTLSCYSADWRTC